ncbi:MAG: (S)-benzoin forming benzil reductase [Bacillaceae bacterium]|nr:(S)-benzoin forming benzil reductase [Bacillaceae bacterium]
MNVFIITGTSRGLGEAIATRLAEQEDHYLFCISRNKSEKLRSIPSDRVQYFEYDLSRPDGIPALMERIFEKIDETSVRTIHLINNAGVLTPIKPIDRADSRDIMQNMMVNLAAPILLTSEFVRRTRKWNVDKCVLNISSGAGKHPYDGWSCYCSSKAGLDMFTRCVSLEQQDQKYPVKVLSLAPGVVDTAMQTLIRSTRKEDFRHVDRFIKLKEEGELRTTDEVAAKIADLLMGPDFEQGGVLSIQDI